MLRGQKILIFEAPGTEILIFGAPGKENIDFLVLWGLKILIFGAPGKKNIDFCFFRTQNIDFWCSGVRKY